VNINFLAIDFDQTIVDLHTGGRWKESARDLAEHVRPAFRHLMRMANDRNVRIAIVTFSPQTCQIREVLEIVFGPSLSDSIPIRGNDMTWKYAGNGLRMGKQEHMASAAEELMTRPMLGVTDVSKSTTLLIDDDPRNVKKCLKDGTRAVWLNPVDPNRFLDDILLLK
jgi:FMN phosphatase YigB (HAD superfamily)